METFDLSPKNEKKIIDKWESLGFLENCKSKKNIAFALEHTANLFFNGTMPIGCKQYEIISFPIVFRVFRNKEEDLTVEEIKKKVYSILQGIQKEYPKLQSELRELEVIGADVESEICALLAKMNSF